MFIIFYFKIHINDLVVFSLQKENVVATASVSLKISIPWFLVLAESQYHLSYSKNADPTLSSSYNL
jgi:hypothetical protein